MQPSVSTRRKLQNLQAELHKEFSALPPELVESQLRIVTATLLNDARFDDFVPLLADRHVRGRLEMHMRELPLHQSA